MSDTIEYPESTMVVMPTIGKFIVRIKRNNNIRTGKLDYYMILIGTDPKNACVNIRAPHNRDEPMKLAYVTSEVECRLDNITPMKGLATVQMIQLGITIARKLCPKATMMELEDYSHFKCSSPDGVLKMALPAFYFAFHRKTWYEDKFGATLKSPKNREQYECGIMNMDNSEKKPGDFNFGTNALNDILIPLYDECPTWGVFFQRIAKKYKNDKCWIVQPWIDEAMRHIFEGSIYDLRDWELNVTKIPEISYYEIDEAVPQLGGEWNPVLERVIHRPFFYQSFHCTNYKKALRRTRGKRFAIRTRKRRS